MNENLEKVKETIKKRTTQDVVEISGRKFRIKKFDPMLGNYILLTLMTTVLPFGLSGVLSKEVGVNIGSGKQISKESFMDLQRDVLSVCYEILPANETPVLHHEGGYGISNPTQEIILGLLISSIAYNFASFFTESPSNLESILGPTME